MEAAGGLKAALEHDNQVEVVWEDGGGGALRILMRNVQGDATQDVGGVQQSSKECSSFGDQASLEQSRWVEEEDYPWSLEDELGFFGAHPEWGVG